METKYFIPKTVEVTKEEYDIYVENLKAMPGKFPSWWESMISQAIASLL